jgi:LemA protein
MKFRAVLAPLFVAAGAALLAGCGLNSVPTAEENAKAKWADVQAAYQRRADTIPALVNTVKGAAGSEGKILTDVVSARAKATQIQVSADDLTDPATRSLRSRRRRPSSRLDRPPARQQSRPIPSSRASRRSRR